jgi:hypothetical protein
MVDVDRHDAIVEREAAVTRSIAGQVPLERAGRNAEHACNFSN